MKAILLDIEGTTTPIDFIHKVLFPYASENIGDFVENNWENLGNEIAQFKREADGDERFAGAFDESSHTSVTEYLRFLVKTDRKSTPLKSIQGEIWKAGYESGELRSQVYDDVPRAFSRWISTGKAIAIYSSGSVLAQKLIFQYSDHGDLTPFIDRYFDTNAGAKRELSSYHKIAADLAFDPAEITFVSDVPAELDAARGAGFETVLSIRPGNAPVDTNGPHSSFSSFDKLE